MTIVLNDICSNPECYNRSVVKHAVTIGKVKVEAGLCNSCHTSAIAVDFARKQQLKDTIYQAMLQYHQLHEMRGKVPEQMLTNAVERILDQTVEKL